MKDNKLLWLVLLGLRLVLLGVETVGIFLPLLLPQNTWSMIAADPALQVDSLFVEMPELRVKAVQENNRAQPTEVKSDFIRKIPSAMNDPIRAIDFTPGVTVQNDVNIRPFVRGGDADQTRVVLNGIPLIQPYHVGGTFSIFNLNTLQAVGLYRDDFPVEFPGALSGVVELKSDTRIPDKLHLRTNLSLVRGDLYAEAPIVANRFSVFGDIQSFLFNRTLHGLLDLSSSLSQDSAYQGEMNGYRDHINMPDFTDMHGGAAWLPKDNVRLDYIGGYSGDAYAVVVPKQTNILSRINPKFGDPSAAVPPVTYSKDPPRPQKLSIDSISSVDINNQTHFLNVAWDATEANLVENNFGIQYQNWKVAFKKGTSSMEPLSLDLSMQSFNYRLSDTYKLDENNRFVFGGAYDYSRQNYTMHLPFVLYDVIVNGNMDMLAPLGFFSDNGFTMAKEDSSRTNFDYLGEFPSRIQFNHKGISEEHFGSAFFSHAFHTSTGWLNYGLRAEYQNTSGELFLAPRLEYKWEMNPKNVLRFTTGLYSQNNLPYYERDQNSALRSEKSLQAGTQWNHVFSKGYRITWDGYYKGYYDIVTASLVSNHTLDQKGFLLPLPGSSLTESELTTLKSTLDSVSDFSQLPDSVQNLAYQNFGGLEFAYANTGTGHSLGSELAFFYTPTLVWSGWLSLDMSVSQRKDGEERAEYAYRYHRPLVINWVNYFDIPGAYEISFTYRYALGQPYTPYSSDGNGRGSFAPIVVGGRNQGRLTPYSRLDLRLTRNAHWHGGEFKSYLEVWNSMNSPNYFGRDNATGQLKSAQLNWPFPVFFLGCSAEF